jgi:hypothetical protein
VRCSRGSKCKLVDQKSGIWLAGKISVVRGTNGHVIWILNVGTFNDIVRPKSTGCPTPRRMHTVARSLTVTER